MKMKLFAALWLALILVYYPCARSKTTAFRRSAFSLTKASA